MTRVVIGEDLHTSLKPEQRSQWIDLINSYAYQPYGTTPDGSYTDGVFSKRKSGHALQTQAMVVAALGVLGGQQVFPVTFYEDVNTSEKAQAWLEQYDWAYAWRGGHFFQSSLTYYSFSALCTDAWRAAVFNWLDSNLDDKTGLWRKGVTLANPDQAIGGSALILSIYQHHDRRFPYPEQLINSMLSFQRPSGSWSDNKRLQRYLDYDALYVLFFASSLAPHYRRDGVVRALDDYARYASTLWSDRAYCEKAEKWSLGSLALLQKMQPEQYQDEVSWTDRFGDPRFFQTQKVEVMS